MLPHKSCEVKREIRMQVWRRRKNPTGIALPYITGVSEDIRRVCSRFCIRAVFESSQTLQLMLTKVRDTLPMGKRSRVVYQILCSCGQVYVGETIRWLETRMKEHQYACE